VRLLRKKHEGFILVESLTAFAISLMIILTLSYCVNEQFSLLNHWEERVNADKIILLHLKVEGDIAENNIPNPLTIKGQKYLFSKKKNSYQVTVNNHVYKN